MNLYDWVVSQAGRVAAPLAGYPGVRLVGKSVRSAVNDAEVQLEALRALRERLEPDIVFTLLDPTVEAEALGLEVEFFERRPPNLAEQELPRLERFMELEPPDPEKTARMPLFLRVVEEMRADGRGLCGAFITGPLTLLSQLMGTESLLEEMGQRDVIKEALAFATSVVGEYAAALASRAHVVMVVDPVAEALEAGSFRAVYRPYLGALFGIIRSAGASGLLHICGDVLQLLEEIGSSGADGLLLDARMDLLQAAERLPKSIVLLGNLDPKRVVHRGTVDDVRWETRRLLRNTKGIRNFVFSTGCDVPLEAPLKNLEAMMEEVRAWRRIP